MGDEENNISYNKSASQLPLYERPGRLNPDRHIPVTRSSRVDVNVHYDEKTKEFVRDSDTPEFTEFSANAMNPFEDTALLSGDIKPKVVGVRKNAPKLESKIFVPELDTEEVRQKIRQPVIAEPEQEQPVYIAEEDKAASSDYIADAFSGVETVETVETHEAKKSSIPVIDIPRLKTYVFLLGIVVVLEVAGIALLIVL